MKCATCGTKDYPGHSFIGCARVMSDEISNLKLQVGQLQKLLASVTVGFCRFCNCGGDAKIQNHLADCDVARLLGITDKRKDEPNNSSCCLSLPRGCHDPGCELFGTGK